MLRPAPRYESGAGLLFGAFVSRRIYVHLASLWVERLRPIKEGEVEYHAWEDGSELYREGEDGPWGGCWFRPVDLRDAIDALLPRQRELIWRHYRLDQVVAAIGRLLGISQRMAQLAHHGALRVLRVMLEVPEPPHEPRPRGDALSCPSGHPRTPENTYIYPDGATECKVCRREGARRRRRARRTQPMKYAKRRPVKVG